MSEWRVSCGQEDCFGGLHTAHLVLPRLDLGFDALKMLSDEVVRELVSPDRSTACRKALVKTTRQSADTHARTSKRLASVPGRSGTTTSHSYVRFTTGVDSVVTDVAMVLCKLGGGSRAERAAVAGYRLGTVELQVRAESGGRRRKSRESVAIGLAMPEEGRQPR